jgi:hypothetical protein
MANEFTAVRYLPGADRNNAVTDMNKRFAKRDNADFYAEVARQIAALAKKRPASEDTVGFTADGIGSIGLIGEYGHIGYGLRTAQRHIRVGRDPSYWSHAFLVHSPLSVDADEIRNPGSAPWIAESTLEPSDLGSRFLEVNGVAPRRLSDYAKAQFDLREPHCVPNVAVIAVGMTTTELQRVMERADDPAVNRLHFDMAGLLGMWYGFLTNQADKPNPLTLGHAIFNSAYIQLAFDAADIDLFPGATVRNTAPDHLWQTANYLSTLLKYIDATTKRPQPRPIHAWYCVREPSAVVFPSGGETLPRTVSELIASMEPRRRR